MTDDNCYCGDIDPGFPGDPKCVNCMTKEKLKREALAATAAAQLALPDGHPERIFTDAEIRDVANVHCDAAGRNRLLLRELRRRML
jgi:hypothetical protein